MDRAELEGLSRESLVARAEAAGIQRARILTRPELVDELLRHDPSATEADLRRARGFFGRARDLLARVVERGLHLPEAADRLRTIVTAGPLPPSVPRAEPQAVPTVTLAEIYAAQGHKARAIETLRRVLDGEPEHGPARALLARLSDGAYVGPVPPLPPEPEHEAVEVEGAEEDACVATPLAGRVRVGWRLREETLGALLVAEARFVVRALVVVPSWDGPRSAIRDVETAPERGEVELDALPDRAVVRVAVGVVSGGDFTPAAHAPEVLRSAGPA